uniref:Putative myb/SANT-like domain-containing protein n=1 Tax=Helianthus annuus TaxID=4232 RepID=A0A251TQX4_HELAN
MYEKTGKTFERKQITNKCDNMKKEWKLYDRLMRLETGIGGTRSFIDASPEWWGEKIKLRAVRYIWRVLNQKHWQKMSKVRVYAYHRTEHVSVQVDIATHKSISQDDFFDGIGGLGIRYRLKVRSWHFVIRSKSKVGIL